MSLIFATQLIAVGTAVLAVFAIVTAWYARRAFMKQSREVAAIEQQVADGQELARRQAEQIKIQADQLELQREQAEEQRKTSARQAEVLDLQATELRESLAERKRETELRRRAQASRVLITQRSSPLLSVNDAPAGQREIKATVINSSDLPIFEAELRWHMGLADQGMPNPEPIGNLAPGLDATHTREFPPGASIAVSGAVLRFRDAAGVIWMRRPDGDLIEQEA